MSGDHRGAIKHQHGRHPMHGFLELVQHGQRAVEGVSQRVQQWASTLQLPGHLAHRSACKTLSSGKPVISDASRQRMQHGAGVNNASMQGQVLMLPMASIHGQVQAASSNDAAARKAELGKATWTLLHMLAAQYPDKPTKQQRRDAKELITCLTRMYPCADCARHFQQIVKKDPPAVGNKEELQLWMCRTHNAVNRSLGKPTFNCDLVASRWAPLDCSQDGLSINSCDMTVGKKR